MSKADLTQDELLEFVGEIYDCAIEPSRWGETFQRIIEHTGGISGVIGIQDVAQHRARFSVEHNTDPHFQKLFHEKYIRINPFGVAAWFHELDEPITVRNFVGDDEYLASKFYREWAAPQNYDDAVSLTLAKTTARYAHMAIARDASKGRFREDELHTLRLLAPHIRRAVTIADLLDARALREDMLSAALDLLAVGIILVEEEGRIVHTNRAGATQIGSRDAVRSEGDYLSARDPKAARDLRDAVVKAVAGSTIDFPKSGVAIPIPSADGRDLAAWVLPLNAGLRGELGAPFAARAAVFLKELGDTSPFPGELFVRRYGISPAECRVLMMLVQGMTIAEACDTLGISENTGRSHLKGLYAKTGAAGQTALVRLAMTAMAPAASE